jgi:imidazole glycerol-phosphate synthase subunit HisH
MSGPTAEVAVLDYGMGNRRSVEKAFEHVGARTVITSDHAVIRAADALVLPGVGAFPRAMANLRSLGLDVVIRERVADGTPLLGICLGMQLLFDGSTELDGARGLGLIAGDVVPLDAHGMRVPHIGWSEVRFERRCALTDGLPVAGAAFYHVHSFVVRPSGAGDVVGTTEYGERFVSFVARENVFGVQFHPEKSSRDGLAVLRAFVSLVAGVPA